MVKMDYKSEIHDKYDRQAVFRRLGKASRESLLKPPHSVFRQSVSHAIHPSLTGADESGQHHQVTQGEVLHVAFVRRFLVLVMLEYTAKN